MNIYVGYLPENMDDEQLKAAFSQYGKVFSAKVIKDRDTGVSRGFGFVQMDNYEGQVAIDNLRNWEIDGKKIKVNVAREREQKNSFGFSGGGRR